MGNKIEFSSFFFSFLSGMMYLGISLAWEVAPNSDSPIFTGVKTRQGVEGYSP